MTRKPIRTRTITAESSAALAAMDGATVTEVVHEEITDHLLPQAPAVVLDTEVSNRLRIGRRYLRATCPDCDGPRSAHGIDPLVFDHLPGCDLGAALRKQLDEDAAVIARRVARGEPAQRSRAATPEERLCLSERGLTPPTHFTTIRLNADGQPVRSWVGLEHEPDLSV